MGSGVRHRAHLQPSSACVHLCQHVVPGLVGLWERDEIDSPHLYLNHCPLITRALCLAYLIVAHVSHLWMTWKILSVVKSTP